VIKGILRKSIEEAVKEVLPTADMGEINLEYPGDFSHGDFSSNIALVLGKKSKMNPLELATSLVEKINSTKSAEITKVEAVAPGFINFYLSPTFFAKEIESISKKQQYGKGESLSGKKIVVEYTNPNPFKQFHIGHLMDNAIGESISRLVEWNGADTKRVCYQGDVGRHVALCIYGMRLLPEPFPDETQTLSKKVAYLGKAYAAGSKAVKDDPSLDELIRSLNKKIYDHSDGEINELYVAGKEWSLLGFEEIYQKLGTKFDRYFFESVTGPIGLKLVEEGLEKGVFEKSEGAIIFPGEKYGEHTRVFVNKEGLPTYEAKELGLAQAKYDEFKHDIAITVTANEINAYFKVIVKALSLINAELAQKIRHISHGLLKLTTGKMSSRTGDVVTAESMIVDTESRVMEKIADREFTDEERKEVAEIVAIGALKYSILKQSPGKDIIFDMEQALSFEGDSGPYLQYAYVRAMAVLAKAATKKAEIGDDSVSATGTSADLQRLLVRFADIVERAGKEYAPQHVTTYLVSVAAEFNSFYANNPILDGGPDSEYRILLTQATSTVLKNGLTILGINTPAKM